MPTNYSKAKTVTDVASHILQYPEQGTNTPEAYKHSIEFVEAESRNTKVGTLSEYANEGYEEFVLKLLDGELILFKQDNKFNIRIFDEIKIDDDYIEIVEKAFIDLMDGTDPGDIQSMTGLQMDRVDEIFAVYKIVLEKRK